jgi:hypothetical protein
LYQTVSEAAGTGVSLGQSRCSDCALMTSSLPRKQTILEPVAIRICAMSGSSTPCIGFHRSDQA